MLLRMVKQTEWAKFLDLLGPSFFDVMSARHIASQLGSLSSHFLTKRGFDALLKEKDAFLRESGLPVVLAKASQGMGRPQRPSLESVQQGEALLRVYFGQIYTSGSSVLLDLRKESFKLGEDGFLHWNPRAAYIEWSSGFRGAVQDLYLGFYTGDDATYEKGLKALGLLPAKQVFTEHFGADTTSVRFSLTDFQMVFHKVFVKCREAGESLPPEFVSFGLYLATLYEHLESLGEAFHVQKAFLSSPGVQV